MESLDTNKKENLKIHGYKIVFIEDGINLDELIRFTKEMFIKKNKFMKMDMYNMEWYYKDKPEKEEKAKKKKKKDN